VLAIKATVNTTNNNTEGETMELVIILGAMAAVLVALYAGL